MNWIVFADDWGRHPSTTQHLIANFPATEHVVWVGSLGTRTPRLDRHDLARIGQRFLGTTEPHLQSVSGRAPDVVLEPRTLPWHSRRVVQMINRLLLDGALSGKVRPAPIALVAHPVAGLYADLCRPLATIYLRLDDWPHYRGVPKAIVAATEPALLRRADLVLAPNALLLEGVTAPHRVLPQGVDVERFVTVPLTPPTTTKVLGFWGSLAPWLDLDLIVAVARMNPDWTFEFIGRVDIDTARLALPNVRLLPAVRHDQLARAASHWRAAWAPFVTGDHILRSSSLKLREYLAAGFPTAATPHPEARTLEHVTMVSDAHTTSAWLDETLRDNHEARLMRRNSMADAGWRARADELRMLAASIR